MNEKSSTPFDLTGMVAIITGAGSGVGRGLALALAGAGAEIVAVGRRLALLEETCHLATQKGARARAIPADVADCAQRDATIAAVAHDHGRLDILVNSAGAQLRKAALEVSEAEWDGLIGVNLKAVFFCCQAAARVMIAQRGGSIINVSSLAAEIGLPNLSVYGASKGGVSQLTKALAVEWAPHGIRVNAIGPGRVRTPMTEALFQDDAVRESFVRLIPLGRGAEPDEIGGAAVFLASGASSYVTGQTIYVDGGWLAGGGIPLK